MRGERLGEKIAIWKARCIRVHLPNEGAWVGSAEDGGRIILEY